ncbi:MAG: ribosome-associated translation inhibitor RaiA [Deltaproteobacteria bacterium]|nr:ribosome-associated translation inhibitor RaiA [Deltaproteobacteria bacterium]
MSKSQSDIAINITFRHTEPTVALKTYASEKIQHILTKYELPAEVEANVILEIEKRDHSADVFIRYLGQDLAAKATTKDLYSAIDKVVDNIDAQLRKHKDKLASHRHA